jgi:amino acid efflux transporter
MATVHERVHHAGLARRIRFPQAVALYVGAVLGSGVLLIPGYAAEAAGPSSVLVWLAMSLLALPMALTLGVLSIRHPDAGGVSAFVRKAFGPDLAAVAGWFFLASVPIGAPVAALAAGGYVRIAFGLPPQMAVVIAGIILAVGIVNNLMGVNFLGRSQVAITGIIVALLVGAVAVAAPHVDAQQFHPFAPHGWVGMGRAASLMFWCYIGWEAVTHLAEEFTDPRRDTIRAILVAAFVVGLLYSAVGLVTVGTGSYGADRSAGSLALIASRFVGPAGGAAVALMAVFCVLGTVNAYVGAASRLAYALAREGAAPAFLGRLNPVRRTPDAALLLLGAAAFLVLGAQAWGGVKLDFLLALPNATFIGTYVLGSLAATRLLRDDRGLWILAWTSLILSITVYAFLGWAALYAPLVGIPVWLLIRRRPASGAR